MRRARPCACCDPPCGRVGCVFHIGVDLAWGTKRAHRARRARRRRPAGARLGVRDRRRDPRRAGAVRRGRLPGRDRRPADRHQRHRQPAGRGRAEPRLRPVRRRRAPVEHRQARVQRHPARRRARPGAGPGHEPAVGTSAPRDRGLPAPGDGRAVPARAHPEVQEQAGPRPRRPSRRAARPDGPARGAGRGRPAARPATRQPPDRGRSCAARWRRRPARASCAWSRTRSTRWSAPTSPSSPRRGPTTSRRTATSRPATSSPRPCPPTSPRAPRPPEGPPVATARSASTPPSTRRCGAAGEQFVALVTSVLDDAGINYLSVTGRTKTVASFAAKAARTLDGVPLFTDPLREITDQIGIRVITYVHSDVSAVADLLRDQVVVHDDRDMGQETAQRGPVRLRQPAPADRDRRRPRGPAVVRAAARAERAGPDPHRAAARVGGVRARHPLQGHDPRRARPRLRPPVHPGRGAARARRPGVLHDPRPAAGPAPSAAGARRRPTTTRGSARASWRRSWPGSTPTRAGRAPTTTPGSPGSCSSSASPRWSSSARCCAPVDEAPITERMGYRYPPGAVRRLDDALLAAFGDSVRRAARQRPPPAALESRLDRLTGNALG